MTQAKKNGIVESKERGGIGGGRRKRVEEEAKFPWRSSGRLKRVNIPSRRQLAARRVGAIVPFVRAGRRRPAPSAPPRQMMAWRSGKIGDKQAPRGEHFDRAAPEGVCFLLSLLPLTRAASQTS